MGEGFSLVRYMEDDTLKMLVAIWYFVLLVSWRFVKKEIFLIEIIYHSIDEFNLFSDALNERFACGFLCDSACKSFHHLCFVTAKPYSLPIVVLYRIQAPY